MTDDESRGEPAIDRFTVTRRHLPHWQSPGAYHYLTLVLADRRICDLTRPRLARIVVGALHHFHGERYALDEYTVMPDHVHLVLQPLRSGNGWVPLRRITHSLKSWTANQINRVLGRGGQLWEDESYDHVIRGGDDFREIVSYIRHNPVEAGLIERAETWPWLGWGDGPCAGLADKQSGT